MTKTQDSYNFPVELVPVLTKHNGTTKQIPNTFSTFRTDTNESLGIVSDKYSLLKHETVVNSFRDALKDMKYEEKIEMTRKGAQLYLTYKLIDETIEVKKGDIVSLQFVVKNSYDGTNTLQAILGAFRLVCTNGMVIGKKFASFSHKHIGSNEAELTKENIVENLGLMTQNFKEILPSLKLMSQKDVKTSPEEIFVKEKIAFPTYLLKAAKEVYERDNDFSVWGVYNSLTSVVSHKIRKETPVASFWFGKVAWETAEKMLK